MPRRKKLVHIRKPKIRVTPNGIKVTKPSARIGGKAGVNVSSRGVSASLRTKAGTISTGRAGSRKARSTGCVVPLIILLFTTVILVFLVI